MNRYLKCSASLLSAFAMAATLAAIPLQAQLSPNAAVYVSGLQGPRGLKFGPDGQLYLAEAGTGGTTSTTGTCTQVVPPIGPYTNGNTSRISKIDATGTRSTVAAGFPSAQAATGDIPGRSRRSLPGRQAVCRARWRRVLSRQSAYSELCRPCQYGDRKLEHRG